MRVVLLLALLALAAVSVSAQDTLCVRLFGTNTTLQNTRLATFVGKVLTNTEVTPAQGVFNNAQTRDFFNGVKKYRTAGTPFATAGGVSPDYTTDAVSRSTLTTKLNNFFGQAFQCAGKTYQCTYGSSQTCNQWDIHRGMNITNGVFTAFNNEIVNAATSMGANTQLQTALRAVLATYGRVGIVADRANMVCTQADCPCATGYYGGNCDSKTDPNSAAALQLPIVSMLIAAILAVFAMRR